MDKCATLRNKIQNEDMTKDLGVVNIEEKMKENSLRWFRHVQSQGISEPMRKIGS